MADTEVVRKSLLDEYAQKHSLKGSLRAELETLSLGMSVRASAEKVGLGVETVRARRKRIYRLTHSVGADDVLQQILKIAIDRLAA